MLHWNGTDWLPVAGPDSGANLNTVKFLAPMDGWAMGYSAIWHWDGSRWSAATLPAPKTMWSIALPSPGEGWAVGHWGTVLRLEEVPTDVSVVDFAATPAPRMSTALWLALACTGLLGLALLGRRTVRGR